jgi:hypothetical protein
MRRERISWKVNREKMKEKKITFHSSRIHERKKKIASYLLLLFFTLYNFQKVFIGKCHAGNFVWCCPPSFNLICYFLFIWRSNHIIANLKVLKLWKEKCEWMNERGYFQHWKCSWTVLERDRSFDRNSTGKMKEDEGGSAVCACATGE